MPTKIWLKPEQLDQTLESDRQDFQFNYKLKLFKHNLKHTEMCLFNKELA